MDCLSSLSLFTWLCHELLICVPVSKKQKDRDFSYHFGIIRDSIFQILQPPIFTAPATAIRYTFFFGGVGSSEIQENREKVNNWGVFPLRLWMLGDLFLLLQPELEGFSMSVCGWISCQLPGLDLHRVQVVYQWVGNDTLTPVLIILWIPVLFLNLLSTIYFWEPSNSSPCFLSRFYSSIQWERWWSTLTPRYIEPGHFTLLTIYFFYSSKNYSC